MTVTICGYQISKMSNGNYWIQKDGGEGMEAPVDKLRALLDDFWEKEF